MSRDDALTLEGQVIEVLRNAMFRVRMDQGQEITAHISGKMRQHNIKVLAGDRVEVEFSPYDLTKGRIRRRL